MYDLIVNLVASVLAGSVVWTAQFLVRFRRRSLMRAFLGLSAGADCLLVAPRHASSPKINSVHRQDVAALVELSILAKECGAQAKVIGAEEAPREFGRVSEFCVGGPDANARTASHLRAALPGVHFDRYAASPDGHTLWVGERAYHREAGVSEHVLLAKTHGPAKAVHPSKAIFVIAGQRARTNLAAAQYLSAQHRELRRKYGTAGQFCLVLEVTQSDNYGSDLVRIAADETVQAFQVRDPAPAFPDSQAGQMAEEAGGERLGT